jgi:hypothetical protein
MYFQSSFFDINVDFTTHLIKEIKLLGSVFLHQIYAYERFNLILKLFVRNGDYSEGSVVQGYCTNGMLTGKGTIEKNVITPNPNLFQHTHFHMLQQMSIASKYLDQHMEVLLRDNPRCNESLLANEHMRKFIGWLWDQISQSDTHTSEYLKKLACGPIFTIVTYQGYDINGCTFNTKQQDKKNMY